MTGKKYHVSVNEHGTVVLLSCRAYKTIVEDDLKFPLIYGEGKKVRNCKNIF